MAQQLVSILYFHEELNSKPHVRPEGSEMILGTFKLSCTSTLVHDIYRLSFRRVTSLLEPHLIQAAYEL